LKWFYDTSTVAATEVARCGSFIGGAQIARGVDYEGIWWSRGFMWFRPPERNTLRLRENGIVLLCLSAQLRSSSVCVCVRMCVCVRVSVCVAPARTFYSLRPGSYSETTWPNRWPRGW
jgi:hypothetical protein